METPINDLSEVRDDVEEAHPELGPDLLSATEAPDAGVDADDLEWLNRLSRMLQPLDGSDVYERIRDLLDRFTNHAMSDEVARLIYDGLISVLADVDLGDAIFTLMRRAAREPELLDALTNRVSAQTALWIRSLVAMYGEYVRKAYQIVNEEPLGWFTLNRWVTRNYINGQVRVRFEVQRNIGDSVEVIDNPRNIQTMAHFLIETLAFLPDPDRADCLDPEALDELAAQCAAVARSINEHKATTAMLESSSDTTDDAATSDQPPADTAATT